MSSGGLNATRLRTLSKPGKYYDLFGLYLRVRPAGSRYWEQRFTVRGRRRTIGIGPYPVVPLLQARETALKNYRVVHSGQEPVGATRSSLGPTFACATEKVIVLRRRNPPNLVYERQWRQSFERHVFPHIGDIPVSQIRASDLAEVFRPIWTTIPALARLTRWRVGLVMIWSSSGGFRRDNPAGPVLDPLLPVQEHTVRHFAALPHRHVGSFLARAWATRCRMAVPVWLELLILTAVRKNEARLARWSDFDFGERIWTIPAAHAKTRREHRVPLCSRVIDLLALLRRARLPGEGLFVRSDGTRLPNSALGSFVHTLDPSCTAHGFRSSFRDWCTETGVDAQVAERCLAHRSRNAYDRTDVLELRRPVMAAWADYVLSSAGELPSRSAEITLIATGRGWADQPGVVWPAP